MPWKIGWVYNGLCDNHKGSGQRQRLGGGSDKEPNINIGYMGGECEQTPEWQYKREKKNAWTAGTAGREGIYGHWETRLVGGETTVKRIK